MAQCPECEAIINVDADDVEEGEVLTCPDCSADLEIISTDPLEFNAPAWIANYGMRFMGTSNYEWMGPNVPRMLAAMKASLGLARSFTYSGRPE